MESNLVTVAQFAKQYNNGKGCTAAYIYTLIGKEDARVFNAVVNIAGIMFIDLNKVKK